MSLLFKVKPEHCNLAICIPYSKEDFFQDKTNVHKDFVRNHCTSWPRYEIEIVEKLVKITTDLSTLNTRVNSKVTLKDFTDLFLNPSNKLIVLVAHSTQNKVEFYDGLYSIDKIVESIPTSYEGFIELCVCEAENLAQNIIFRNNNCKVRYVNEKASIFIWLYFYWILIRYLHENETDYFTALKEASTIFENQILNA